MDGLRREMRSGAATSARIIAWYLDQIEARNAVLNAVLEVNPEALKTAQARDEERRAGRIRSPLHGIPVLLKDNLDTADRMQTTAGSLALLDAGVARDAAVVARLRAAGAVVLGKTNLSEWANFRGGSAGFPTVDGWSARGGFTHNPYRLDATAGGSSSGSAVGVAANLAPLAVGTDTSGSVTYPAGATNTVGLRPTVGLVSQAGIVPIAATFDTAGPMARTVTDAAVLLETLRSPFGKALSRRQPRGYRPFLRRDGLRGVRIGVDPAHFDAEAEGVPTDAEVFDLAEALTALREAGATVVEVEVPAPDADAFTVLLCEFKPLIARYLQSRTRTTMRSLADLIAFNNAHCGEEMPYFGQELFLAAQATEGLKGEEYASAAQACRRARATYAAFFTDRRLDALAGPSAGYALILAAMLSAGPHLSVPAGFAPTGRPKGLSLLARPFQEGPLLGYGYAFEQATRHRRPPTFSGSPADRPPLYPGCVLAGAAGAGVPDPFSTSAAAFAARLV